MQVYICLDYLQNGLSRGNLQDISFPKVETVTCNFKTAIWISFWYSYVSSFKVKKVRKQFWGSSFSIKIK